MLRALFWISELIIVALVVVPVARFLMYQWQIRRQEFLSRLSGKALTVYLARFYGPAVDQAAGNETEAFKTEVYDKIAGRHLYVGPAILLIIVVALLGGIVIATAVRSGYERYITFYQYWFDLEQGLAKGVALPHLQVSDLDSVVFPFQDVALDLQTLAAISGGYLYVVGVVIQGFRARTLMSSDLLWCSFRMVIAVPLGLSLGQVANQSVAAFVAFALGAFPIEALSRILRRLLTKTLNQTEDETSDQLIKLSGVTPEVSAALSGEGITAIQQLASHDPVALAVRTGLPFNYILCLVSQSQAWCYLGGTAGSLAALCLGDARSIARLSRRLEATPADAEANAVLDAAAASTKLDKAVLKSGFNAIADDPYTQFLVQFAS